MPDEHVRGARTIDDMLGAGGRLSDDLRGIAAQLKCSERTRAQLADDLMLVALDADFLEADAARLREVIDAVREGCREEYIIPIGGGVSRLTVLVSSKEGLQALRDILRGEEGERGE